MTEEQISPRSYLDPTVNVTNIVAEAVKRLDGLREAETRRVDEKVDAIVLAADQRFQAQQLALKDALISQEKAVAAALDGTREAINKADATTDKRFDLLSEKIDGIGEAINKTAGAAGIFVTHSDLSVEMEKLRNSFEAMLRPVITFMNSNQGKTEQTSHLWGYLVGVVGITSSIILLVLKLSGK